MLSVERGTAPCGAPLRKISTVDAGFLGRFDVSVVRLAQDFTLSLTQSRICRRENARF